MDENAIVDRIITELERDGIALLPDLLDDSRLRAMQHSFNTRLKRLRWNNFDGYEKIEPFRHMVENVLTLEQGFIDIALHPIVKRAVREYIGTQFELVEAKGWLSLPTKRHFHGWHGDAWYDQSVVETIPRELKMGIYLSDVETGAFSYIRGSQCQTHPRNFRKEEMDNLESEQLTVIAGKAGSAFLFDTSGIHRQSTPILSPRHAVFYCYHDPSIPLQPEDLTYNRYHPLVLNAAFLGGLSREDQEILGFGNKANHVTGFEREPAHALLQSTFRWMFDRGLRFQEFKTQAAGKLRRSLKR